MISHLVFRTGKNNSTWQWVFWLSDLSLWHLLSLFLRGFVGLPWQSKQNSSDTNAWLSALINRLIICPWNLCDAGESQAFLRIIYTTINNLCCPLLALSVSARVIKSRRLSGPKPRLEQSGHVNSTYRCVHIELCFIVVFWLICIHTVYL